MNKETIYSKAVGIIFSIIMASIICVFGCASGDIEDSSISYSFNGENREYSFSDDEVSYEWIESDAPNYYKVIGEANFENEPTSEITMSGLDSLGRTQSVYAVVNYDMVEESAGWREDFKTGSNPSGWPKKNMETDIELASGKVYHGWFWNRSHLLADSLGGHAVKENVITGTRMQNVGDNTRNPGGGMAYIESKVRDYIYDNPNVTVSYEAIPVYQDDELIPRAVVVNALSDDGAINEQVIVYNAAKGYDIDYYTGEARVIIGSD